MEHLVKGKFGLVQKKIFLGYVKTLFLAGLLLLHILVIL